MYTARSNGKSISYSFDRDRFSDFDRLYVIAALNRRASEYKTYVRTRIGSFDTIAMLDTGNSFATCINSEMKRLLSITSKDLQPYEGRRSIGTAKASARMKIEGETKKEYEIFLSPSLPPIRTKLVVLPELGMPCNISGRTMEECGISILAGKHAKYRGEEIPLITRKDSGPDISRYSAHLLPLYTSCDAVIQPFERVHVSAIAVDRWGNKEVDCAILAPSSRFEELYEISPWRSAMVSLRRGEGDSENRYRTKVGMINTTTRPIKIPKGTFYGEAELVTNIRNPQRDEYRVCFISNKERHEGYISISGGKVKRSRNTNSIGAIIKSGSAKQCNKVPVSVDTGSKSKPVSAKRCNKVPRSADAGYTLPPSPDKQNDPLAGDAVIIPDWMKGETSKANWQQRYDYLSELFKVKGNKNLSNLERRQKFLSLLLLHWNLFAWDGTYGKTDLVQHYIRTPPDCKPVNDRYRPPNPALRDSLRKQLDKWLHHGCIEPSDSEWNSNLLAVVKSSDINSVRWVVDYRRVNMATTIDRFPIGDIHDNLSRLGKSKYFSCLDNSGAFHCIEIAPEDRHKTSFATPFNCWQFKRLPFGLSGGPSSYARLVVQVLRNIPPEEAVAYVDDILIHSATYEEHLKNLNKVFNAYTKAGLRLNPKKCHFMASKIDYLGHTVSEAGIEPQEAYLKIVKDWPLPVCRHDISVFQGKVGYYRKFIKDFAKISKPLTDLLKIAEDKPKSKTVPKTVLSKSQRRKIMEEPIKLPPEAVQAFNQLKAALLNPPILSHPRFDNLPKGEELSNEYYILDTDWCQETNTCSGVLSQNQKMKDNNYQEKVIGYASKKLNKSQANYSSPKGEICAILLMIDAFKYHLMIGKFLLRTDNIAARALKDNTAPTGYLSRWQARLANFDFVSTHRAGTKHGNADSLSRINHTSNRPEDNEDVFDEKTDRQYLFAIDEDGTGSSTRDETWTATYLHEVQEEDPDLSDLRKWVALGRKPDTQLRAEASPDLKTYINLFDHLYIDERNVLMYEYHHSPPDGLGSRKRNLVVLPPIALVDAVRLFHEKQAHVGVRNTVDQSLRYVYGIGLRDAAEYVCRTCLVCQAKGGKPKKQDYSLIVPRQGVPFQTINIDFVGPLIPSKRYHNIYILTVEDMLTKWVEAFPLKRATALEVANKLTTEIFPRHGYPEFVKSDRGSHFKNSTMQELARITGMKLIYSPSYHPQSNPVERAHGTIKNMIKAMVIDLSDDNDPSSWESHLPQALFCYRTTRHSTTQQSPFEMLFGYSPSTEASLIFGPPPDREDYEDHRSYAIAHRDRMNRAFRWANDNITATIARRRRYHYNHPKRLFNVGDKVWLLTPIIRPGQRKSFISPYTGPWTVSERVNEVVYKIDPHHQWSRKGAEVVTVDRLKRYLAPEDEGDTFAETHPPGIRQDLSLPGNEFLETFRTKGKSSAVTHNDDEDDDKGHQGRRPPDPHPQLGPANPPAPPPAAPPPPEPPQQPLSPLPSPPNSPPPADNDDEVFDYPQPDALAPPVIVEEDNPPPPQQPDTPVAMPAAPVTGTRPKTRKPVPEWRSRQKGYWKDVAPTRRLPDRASANKTFRGSQVYRPERRQLQIHPPDVDISELQQPVTDEASSDDTQRAALTSPQLEWDNYDLARKSPFVHAPTSDDLMTERPAQSIDTPVGRMDLADQSSVLARRKLIAQKNDCRSSKVSSVRKSTKQTRRQGHDYRPHGKSVRGNDLAVIPEREKAPVLPSFPPRASVPPVKQMARSRSLQPPSLQRPTTRSKSVQPQNSQIRLSAASLRVNKAVALREQLPLGAKPKTRSPLASSVRERITASPSSFTDVDFEGQTEALRRTIISGQMLIDKTAKQRAATRERDRSLVNAITDASCSHAPP